MSSSSRLCVAHRTKTCVVRVGPWARPLRLWVCLTVGGFNTSALFFICSWRFAVKSKFELRQCARVKQEASRWSPDLTAGTNTSSSLLAETHPAPKNNLSLLERLRWGKINQSDG